MDFIKDADCTKETPVRLGVPDAPIYGKGIKLKPILTGEFNTDDIYTNDWNYPVGAFHGADGGSC